MRSVRITVVPNDSDDARLGRLGCYTTLTEDGATTSTNTFVHKSRLALMFPNNMNEQCNRCGQRSTLQHATWECAAIWPSEDSTNTTHHTKTWEAALASPALEDQTILVRRAWRGAAESGALD